MLVVVSFLLQVSTGPHDDARGGRVVSRGPMLVSQDDVKIEEQVSCGKIRLVALVLYSCMSSNPTRGQQVWSGHTSALSWWSKHQ